METCLKQKCVEISVDCATNRFHSAKVNLAGNISLHLFKFIVLAISKQTLHNRETRS
jgi:hypothetical protein